VRRQVSDEALRAHCRAQLVRLFGERAGSPVGDALKDWATDPLTATDDDQDAVGHHASAPSRSADEGAWKGRLVGIGSEWSLQFPGYLAGAVDAAERGLREALAEMARPTQEPAE
jgi:monoamine oxidase